MNKGHYVGFPCPNCDAFDNKVTDSRLLKASPPSRRRRHECKQCNHRYTTYETLRAESPQVTLDNLTAYYLRLFASL